MRAAITRAPGGPIEVSRAEDPSARSGEVLVRVHAASINRLDRLVFDGVGLGAVASFPLIQGLDAAGTVETGGAAFQPGMRVVVKPTIPCRRCRECRAGRRADCRAARTMGVHRPGGFAELVSVPRANLLAIPADIGDAEAAAAAHVYPVALHMIRSAALEAGESVLVTSAGGAIAPAAAQLAGALGARVLAVASDERKAAAAREDGAEPVEGGADLVDRLLDLTDGEGVDVILDAAGDPSVLPAAVAALARGGRLVVIGAHVGSRLDLDLDLLYRRRQRVIGAASSTDAEFHEAFRLMSVHGLNPAIAAVRPLEEIGEAMDSVLDRGRIGKIVLEVAR